MNLIFSIQVLQGFVATISCFIIALLVAFSSKEKASRLFVILSFSIGLWCLSPPLVNYLENTNIGIFVHRLSYIFGILIMPIFLHFVIEIARVDLKRIIRNAFYIAFAGLFCFSQSPLFIRSLTKHGGMKQTNPGILYLFFVLVFAVTIYYCLFILWNSIKEEKNKTKKSQLKITFYAYIISYGAGFFYFLTIYRLIPIWTQAGYLVCVSNLILFYAINQYKLLDFEDEYNGKFCEFKSSHINSTMEVAKNLIEMKEMATLSRHSVRLISRALNVKSVSLYVKEETGFVLKSEIGKERVKVIDCIEFISLLEEKKEPLSATALSAWAEEIRIRSLRVCSSYIKGVLEAHLIIPVVYDSVIAFFAIGTKKDLSPYTKDDITNSLLIAYATSITLKNILLNTRVIRDKLTGLFNNVYFEEQIENEIERARIEQKKFILAFLDIDHFKKINDEHGHLKGNEVLKSISRVMVEALRPSDILCRWGGEEFAIIMRDTAVELSYNIVERLRSFVESNVKINGYGVTVSIGVTECSVDFRYNTQEVKLKLLEQVDQALYQAKNNGRNQIQVM